VIKCIYIYKCYVERGGLSFTLDKVGECVINKLGTIVVVVVVVVAVVVGLYADIHRGSFHTHTLLRAHALEC